MKFDRTFRRFLILVFVLYLFIRVLHLPQALGFGSDAGRDFLRIWDLYEKKDFTLIGPPSRFAVQGHSFYFGPAPYYLMLPALIAGNWSVLFASYYLIFLGALTFLLSLLILATTLIKVDRFLIYSYAILSLFFPLLVETSRTYWNPYFMPGVSFLVLAFLVKIKNTALNTLNSVVLGFLFGLGFQFHFSYILTIILSIIILLLFRKLTVKGIAYTLFGFCFGSLPLILFDLRNNFYNVSVFVASVQNWTTTSKSAGLGTYYIISLIPFAAYFAAYLLVKLKKINPNLALGLLLGYVIFCFLYIIPSPKKGFDMASNWNYQGISKAAMIIRSENPKNYNIVDQLTGDNRALSLRFLLTSQGSEPMAVTEYPTADYLYVITHEPLEKILINPVWEISSGGNVNKVKEWNINDAVTLYKLDNPI